MIDQTSLRMMQLAGQGYCCSQILILLALEGMGRENPDLVRAWRACATAWATVTAPAEC